MSTGGVNPVFSPDGNWLAFYSSPERAILKISVAGGTPITLCEVADTPSGISWNGDHIVFGQGSGGIWRVSQDAGKPEVLVTPQQGELTVAPQILPDGDTPLFTAARPKRTDSRRGRGIGRASSRNR